MIFTYNICKINVIHLNVYQLFCIEMKLNMVQKNWKWACFLFCVISSIMTLCDTVIRIYFMNKRLYSAENLVLICNYIFFVIEMRVRKGIKILKSNKFIYHITNQVFYPGNLISPRSFLIIKTDVFYFSLGFEARKWYFQKEQ